MKKKTVISFIMLIIWIFLIYYFSSQVADNSNKLSDGIMSTMIDFIEGVFPNSSWDFSNLHFYIRKTAHFIAYFILGGLTMNAFRHLGLRKVRLICFALLFCILYAVSDEVHQIFVPGRSGQVSDVILDSVGALSGILIYFVLFKNRCLSLRRKMNIYQHLHSDKVK